MSHRETSLDMDPEEMRRLGYQVVDWVVDRAAGLAGEPPWLGGSREELEPLLREAAPEEGRPLDAVLERAVADVLPRAGRIDHPRFFAFVPSSPVWASILGDWLATGYNVFQGTWLESAGPSQLELVVLDWFREWLGMPESAGGLFTSGGSAANLGAVVAAREAAGDPERPAVLLGEQGHSSLERAARIAGIRRDGIRKIKSDKHFRLTPEAAAVALREARDAGLTPICLCASAGATNTGAVDPLEALAALAREEGVWLHVDGAYGGFTVLTGEGRAALRGIGEADSVTLDPHKWLFQPYEAGCLMVRDVRLLETAFRVLPEYLQDTQLGFEHVNFADRGVQLTRRFRALKVWATVQALGTRALGEAVAAGMDLARLAGARIEESEILELLSPPSLGIVCFRARPSGWTGDEAALEALNRDLQDRIVEEGTAMMSSTRLHGTYALRLCILNHRSGPGDVEATLARLEALAGSAAGAA